MIAYDSQRPFVAIFDGKWPFIIANAYS